MKTLEPIERARWRKGVVAGLLGLLAGCATAPAPKPAQNFIFYPPPPAPARLQFLASYSSEADLGGGAGKFATFVTGKEAPKTPIVKPYGLAFSQGKLYVCDVSSRTVRILDLEKRKMATFVPQGEGRLRSPINLAVDRDGTRYVADTARNQVLIYGPNDAYLGALGQSAEVSPPGGAVTSTNPAQAAAGKPEMKPIDVAIAGNRLYVADLNNHCVRVYDKAKRELLFKIPQNPEGEKDKLFAPTNLALDSQGRLYVSDIGGFRVQEYDAEGKYLRTFGQLGDRPGEFARPKGVAVDREGRLYVVDAAAQVVQIFDPEGRLLLFFGEPGGSAAALDLPAKVILDYDHVTLFQKYAAPGFVLEYLVIVSNQLGDRKVSVYGFGQKR